MALVAFLLLIQAPFTPEALVDALVAEHGYGVVGSSPSQAPMAARDEARIRSEWRLRPDAALPGVYRAEVAPYAETFDEERFPLTRGGIPVAEGRLPFVAAGDLARPGGVRVRVDRLALLLGLGAIKMPGAYGRRVARVRLDPAKRFDRLALVAAIVGGTPSADGRAIEFDPAGYRRLAVATLKTEALRTEFAGDPIPKGERRAYWESRPIRLALGASGFYAAPESEIAAMARTSGRAFVAEVPTLSGQGGEIAGQLLEILRRNEARPPFALAPGLTLPETPRVKVSGLSGLGRLVLPAQGSGPERYL